MSIRSYIVVTASLVFSLMVCGSVMAQGDQPATETQAAPSTESQAIQDSQVRATILSKLNLAKFDDADESSCAGNSRCSLVARQKCVVNACNSTESKNPIKCFDEKIEVDFKLASELLCQAIESPTVENRKAFLEAFPNITPEANFVNNIAFAQAVKGNSAACQNVVKEFVGPYGQAWKLPWLVSLSGCRIIAKESTRVEEENDYLIWHSIPMKTATCDTIFNSEIKQACYAGVEAP